MKALHNVWRKKIRKCEDINFFGRKKNKVSKRGFCINVKTKRPSNYYRVKRAVGENVKKPTHKRKHIPTYPHSTYSM